MSVVSHVGLACSAEITLGWDPSPGKDVVGYRLWYGPSSRQYTHSIEVGNETRYRVSELDPDSTYFFAITAYDAYGVESAFSKELGPTSFALFQNCPNPFNADTRISFGVLSPTHVNVFIYNTLGQLVREMPLAQEYALGVHSVRWDGRDNRHRAVSSGVYLYRLITPTGATARRMILLR